MAHPYLVAPDLGAGVDAVHVLHHARLQTVAVEGADVVLGAGVSHANARPT
jgi:hypothetical protein